MSKDISKPEQLITEHIDIWTSAVLAKSTSGRGSSKKYELYGITKLRELILELAVRGKLVPQDADDEPASVLLEKIFQELSVPIKNDNIKKNKPLPKIMESEKPFNKPKNWEWERFVNLTISTQVGLDRGKAEQSNEFEHIYFKMNNINNSGGLNWDTLARVNVSETEKEKYRLYEGDFLFNTRNSQELVGKTCVIRDMPEEVIIYNNNIMRARISKILPEFLDYWFRSASGKLLLNELKSSTTNVSAIYQKKLFTLFCPVAPLLEQQRIVAKVDELMLLCDQLEQQTEASIEAHATLVEVLLATLTDSADANELAQNWARISEHFDSLFTTEQSIEALKQTVLQLAVMGKLVPQNPEDEPASVLLEKIAEEKEKLIKEKKIKKQKALLPITEEEKPFGLPTGWEWCCLGTLTTIRGGKRLPKGYQLTTEKTPYIYIRVTDMRNGSIRDDDIHYISEEVQSQISNYIITQDDIYMTIVGATIGKCGLVPSKFDGMNLTENAARIIPFYGVEKNYLFKCLDSSFAQKQFFDKTKQVGVQKMALNRLSSTKIPLPPLAEQQRIVAKVDELMAICDQLKVKLQQSQETQVQLTDALVDRALG
ncbi:restriction endonuclease subunit S [Psychrobacter sp.]|uniref:restriction endonuclease subunit S n=1 Tax=Psychrobacter sp. TaxID=56811 RepID=UPI003001BD76